MATKSFLLVLLGCAACSAQLVTTSLGQIQGFDYLTSKGVESEIFLGIPFAKPPVGDLRHELPEELDAFPTPVINATAFGWSCIPHVKAAVVYPVNEDCLTLNVFRPKTPSTRPRPVLVWIHGGGFEIGSASLFQYKGFADVYIPEDIIVVTIQYRLGVYGFLHGGDVAGNLGLYDMTAALKFINKHIGAFGGDKDAVTLWGLSAGGCAAGQLALSPLSRDLFRAQIEMSGSPHTAWGYGPTVQNNTLDFFGALGCPQGNGAKACLKTKSVQEIYDAVMQIGYTTNDLNTIKWGPVIDGVFMTDNADELLLTAPKKPTILGVSNKDAGYFALMGKSPFIQNVSQPASVLNTYGRQEVSDIIKHFITPDMFGSNTSAVINILENYYLGKPSFLKTKSYYLDRYNQFLTDIFFHVPAVHEAILKRNLDIPTYVYSFDHFNEVIWQNSGIPRLAQGSVHINEYAYMFNFFALGAFPLEGLDGIVAFALQKAIINFTKTTVPHIPFFNWQPFNQQNRYLSFGFPFPVMKNNYYSDAYQVWEEVKDYGFDVISMMKTFN